MVAQKTPQPAVMKGGVKVYALDIVNKFANPIQLYILIGLVLAITFVKEIPERLRTQSGTFLGRLFLFSLTIAIGQFYSWTNGLLMGVLSLLLLSLSPRSLEGFHPWSVKTVENNKKWFSERLLKENPVAIEEETVSTQAVQDNTNSSRSSVAQGTSNK
jgi:hypothetical protein